MERNIYLINQNKSKIEICITELKRWIVFDPQKPVPLPMSIAMKYKDGYKLSICDHPEKFYNSNRQFKHLIIRDAGIGDILLLEPVIRAKKNKGNVHITFITRFTDVLLNNPNVDIQIEQKGKSDIPVKFEDYGTWSDMRSYSETAASRDKKHRTDVYNEQFDVCVTDKEPRIYINKNEKSILKKKKGFMYIGIQLDASHRYRKFLHTVELINTLSKTENTKIVIFGDKKYVSGYDKNTNIIDMQEKTTIRQAMLIIKDLDYMVAVDSGLMHVALSYHIPTVCIFSIISPDLRLKYYTGQRRVLTASVDCIGCGDLHMSSCKKNDKTPPCMNIDIQKIIDAVNEMEPEKNKRLFDGEKKYIEKKVNIKLTSDKKLTMPIIVQNEEKNLPRFIDLVMRNKNIGRVIAIDGGSTDKTVELLEKAGAEVHVHPYIKTYHEQQAMQRNISCSYVADGQNILIMDIDECFSKDLEEYLPFLCETDIQYGFISRRTFNLFEDTKYPERQIKDYPDYQPRFYKWDRQYKFVGCAHHITLNCPKPVKIDKDIIHFEKEGKNREDIEKQWENMMIGAKQYAVC